LCVTYILCDSMCIYYRILSLCSLHVYCDCYIYHLFNKSHWNGHQIVKILNLFKQNHSYFKKQNMQLSSHWNKKKSINSWKDLCITLWIQPEVWNPTNLTISLAVVDFFMNLDLDHQAWALVLSKKTVGMQENPVY